ncbi:RepA leader peptide Tap [Klebsiella pneumoniae]|nr:RepA leader peptide Tap [Klebsiella pneumoniae]
MANKRRLPGPTGKVQDFFLCSLLLCNISAGWCD